MMSVSSRNTVCLYEDLRPSISQGQLHASNKFTSENFYSRFVKLKAEWIQNGAVSAWPVLSSSYRELKLGCKHSIDTNRNIPGWRQMNLLRGRL